MPVIAVFSMTHYCNFYCLMCPFGDADKKGQIQLARRNDLTTEQWKTVFESRQALHMGNYRGR